MSDQGVHLFSNGFEFECWTERNCDRCVRFPNCDLLAALFTDGLAEGMYQGQVTPETAERLGYTDEYIGVLGWPCKERQAQDAPPAPAAVEMVKAGAEMLPGFDATTPPTTGARGGGGAD